MPKLDEGEKITIIIIIIVFEIIIVCESSNCCQGCQLGAQNKQMLLGGWNSSIHSFIYSRTSIDRLLLSVHYPRFRLISYQWWVIELVLISRNEATKGPKKEPTAT